MTASFLGGMTTLLSSSRLWKSVTSSMPVRSSSARSPSVRLELLLCPNMLDPPLFLTQETPTSVVDVAERTGYKLVSKLRVLGLWHEVGQRGSIALTPVCRRKFDSWPSASELYGSLLLRVQVSSTSSSFPRLHGVPALLLLTRRLSRLCGTTWFVPSTRKPLWILQEPLYCSSWGGRMSLYPDSSLV